MRSLLKGVHLTPLLPALWKVEQYPRGTIHPFQVWSSLLTDGAHVELIFALYDSIT